MEGTSLQERTSSGSSAAQRVQALPAPQGAGTRAHLARGCPCPGADVEENVALKPVAWGRMAGEPQAAARRHGAFCSQHLRAGPRPLTCCGSEAAGSRRAVHVWRPCRAHERGCWEPRSQAASGESWARAGISGRLVLHWEILFLSLS